MTGTCVPSDFLSVDMRLCIQTILCLRMPVWSFESCSVISVLNTYFMILQLFFFSFLFTTLHPLALKLYQKSRFIFVSSNSNAEFDNIS